MDENTKKMIKDKLEEALTNGKDVVENVKEISKNVTKEILENSKEEGDDLKRIAGDVLKESINSLGELGKGTFEYLKAVGSGFIAGIKESSTKDNHLVQSAFGSIFEGLKQLTTAGIYVTKETAKNISGALEKSYKKHKENKNKDENE